MYDILQVIVHAGCSLFVRAEQQTACLPQVHEAVLCPVTTMLLPVLYRLCFEVTVYPEIP